MAGLDIREDKSGAATLEIRVIPRSSRSEIVGLQGGGLKIKLRSAPVEGAANDELIKLLSKEFNISRSDIEIITGQTSKHKRIRITGITSARINAILSEKS